MFNQELLIADLIQLGFILFSNQNINVLLFINQNITVIILNSTIIINQTITVLKYISAQQSRS